MILEVVPRASDDFLFYKSYMREPRRVAFGRDRSEFRPICLRFVTNGDKKGERSVTNTESRTGYPMVVQLQSVMRHTTVILRKA